MEEKEEEEEWRVWETVELGRWGRGGRLVAVAEAGREGLRKTGSSVEVDEGCCCWVGWCEEEVLETSSGEVTTALLPSNFPSRGNPLSPAMAPAAGVLGREFMSVVRRPLSPAFAAASRANRAPSLALLAPKPATGASPCPDSSLPSRICLDSPLTLPTFFLLGICCAFCPDSPMDPKPAADTAP